MTTLLLGANADWPDIKESGDGSTLVVVAETGGSSIAYAECAGDNATCASVSNWSITTNILSGHADQGNAHKPQVMMNGDGDVFVTYERPVSGGSPDDAKIIPMCSGGSFDTSKIARLNSSSGSWSDAYLGLGNATAWTTLRGDGINDEIVAGYIQKTTTAGSHFKGYWYSAPFSDFCP